MAFTDDDLNWAKENMQSVQMKNLIARLEAAEELNLAFEDWKEGEISDTDLEAFEERWRKAAGK